MNYKQRGRFRGEATVVTLKQFHELTLNKLQKSLHNVKPPDAWRIGPVIRIRRVFKDSRGAIWTGLKKPYLKHMKYR